MASRGIPVKKVPALKIFVINKGGGGFLINSIFGQQFSEPAAGLDSVFIIFRDCGPPQAENFAILESGNAIFLKEIIISEVNIPKISA